MLTVIGLLLLANIMGIVSTFVFDHGRVFGLVQLFSFANEGNIPTFYSSIQLMVAGVLLYVIGEQHRSHQAGYLSWMVLAAIFIYLGIDEFAQIHERFDRPFHKRYQLSGFLYFSWVVPYGFAVLVFVIAYLRFLLKLPKRTARLFLAAGITYVCGAIGFETLGANHFEKFGNDNVTFSLLWTTEELLEMLGIALFIYALLAYICREFQSIQAIVRDVCDG